MPELPKHSVVQPRGGSLQRTGEIRRLCAKPSLERIFASQGEQGILRAYKEHGYRIREIAAHLGVHYATVSRRLTQLEQAK